MLMGTQIIAFFVGSRAIVHGNGNVNAKGCKMVKQSIEKALAAFSFGQIQDFMTLHGVMRRSGISIADLEGHVRGERALRAEETEKIRQHREKRPDCPKCGNKLSMRAINLPKGPANRKGWKSLWYCPAGECVYEMYSRLTLADEIKRVKSDTKKCR